jgi:hypothetical protein
MRLNPQRYRWLEKYIQKCRSNKKDGERDRRAEKEKFAAAPLVKCRTEVVASESTTKARSALLQQYDCDKEDGEDDLYVR